jgi:hypothetical protein
MDFRFRRSDAWPRREIETRGQLVGLARAAHVEAAPGLSSPAVCRKSRSKLSAARVTLASIAFARSVAL